MAFTPAHRSEHAAERVSSGRRSAFRQSSSRRNLFGGGGGGGGGNWVCFPFPCSFAKLNARTLLFVFLHVVLVWFMALGMVFSRSFLSHALAWGSRFPSEKSEELPRSVPVCRIAPYSFPSTSGFSSERLPSSASTSSSDRAEGRRSSSSSSSSSALPLVLFFAGVEGSGHKFFEQVFRHLPQMNASISVFEPELHLTFEKSQKFHGKYKVCPPLPYARPTEDYFQEMKKRLEETKANVYIRSRDSYPLGRSRTPLARPDLISMLQWDGILYNLKVLFLLRSLPDAVRSAYRMGYHAGDVGLQVRIVEDGMIILENSLRILPCGKYITMEMDNVLKHPQAAGDVLSSFLGLNISASDVVEAIRFANSSKPSHNMTYPSFGQTSLPDFFRERAGLLWPVLDACSRVPAFFPTSPRDWPEALDSGVGR